MATNKLIIAICSVALLSLAFVLTAAHEVDSSHKPEKKVDVVVEGMVYCQSCDRYGTWSLTRAEPVASANVSVICKNYGEQVTFYKVYQTDEHGYFYAQLDGFKMSYSLLDHPLQACCVKLVSSPLANCSLLSNVNNGLYGAPLRYKTILRGTHYEAVVYAAGPLAFRPNQCPAETRP